MVQKSQTRYCERGKKKNIENLLRTQKVKKASITCLNQAVSEFTPSFLRIRGEGWKEVNQDR